MKDTQPEFTAQELLDMETDYPDDIDVAIEYEIDCQQNYGEYGEME